MAKAKVTANKIISAAKTRGPDGQEYQVVWNVRRRSWAIEHNSVHLPHFANDKDAAVDLAIRQARRAHINGFNVVVRSTNTDAIVVEWLST